MAPLKIHPKQRCARCKHTFEDHAKAGPRAERYKFVPGAFDVATFHGSNRYCEQPLCSCIEFLEKKLAAKPAA